MRISTGNGVIGIQTDGGTPLEFIDIMIESRPFLPHTIDCIRDAMNGDPDYTEMAVAKLQRLSALSVIAQSIR